MALVQPVALRSPKPSMLVRVQHAVLSLPTGCGKGLRSRLVAALVSADPPSLRDQSPESLRRLLLLDAWQSGLLHHLAKVATGNGSGVRLPQHPRAVAGGKSHFCHWISLWRFGLDDGQPLATMRGLINPFVLSKTPRVTQHSWGIFIRRGTPPNTFE